MGREERECEADRLGEWTEEGGGDRYECLVTFHCWSFPSRVLAWTNNQASM